MGLAYGLDIYTPNSQGGERWQPIMKNKLTREAFKTVDELFARMDAMKQGNSNLQLRVVQFEDDEPVYSV